MSEFCKDQKRYVLHTDGYIHGWVLFEAAIMEVDWQVGWLTGLLVAEKSFW